MCVIHTFSPSQSIHRSSGKICCKVILSMLPKTTRRGLNFLSDSSKVPSPMSPACHNSSQSAKCSKIVGSRYPCVSERSPTFKRAMIYCDRSESMLAVTFLNCGYALLQRRITVLSASMYRMIILLNPGLLPVWDTTFPNFLLVRSIQPNP